MTRVTNRHRDVMAGCFVCHGTDAFWTSANAQALAAKHHDCTGHQTWCDIVMRVTYGANTVDDRQIDIEDAIAAAPARQHRRLADILHEAFDSSGGRPEAAPLTDPHAPTDASAGQVDRWRLDSATGRRSLPDRHDA